VTYGLRAHLGSLVLATSAHPSAAHDIVTSGTPADWSRAARVIASFDGRVHCFSLLPDGESAHVVWGLPRQAAVLDVATGVRHGSTLAAETYAVDCPQLSPNGQTLLFTRASHGASPQIMRAKVDGSGAEAITNGAEPLWLPNGEEFVFNVDVRHIGLFSMSTMSYDLLYEEGEQSARRIYKKAVSADGHFIAALFNTNSANRKLELHALPNLAVASAWAVPFAVQGLHFDGRTLMLSDASGASTLERLDWRSGQATRIGSVRGLVVDSALRLQSGDRLLLSKTKRNDVWVHEPGQAPRQLTRDGVNYVASGSKDGHVLVAKDIGHRLVIVRYDPQGRSTQLTSGPEDSVPSFAIDGSTWLYADYQRKALVLCERDRCNDLRQDDLMPTWPVMSPDMRRVAFINAVGAPRLHVVDRDGHNERDLGPAAVECPPVWTGNSSLWAFAGVDNSRRWDEVDIATGKKTGRSKRADNSNADNQSCDPSEDATPESAFFRRARVTATEAWTVAIAPTLSGLD
jgi:Tol biopolymer transport system component